MIKKLLFLVLLIVLQTNLLKAQVELNWVNGYGNGTNNLWTWPLKIDANKNIYTGGQFSSTIDFDPSSGVFNLTSIGNNDAFIMKSNENGGLIWVKSFGGLSNSSASPHSIVISSSNEIYIAGSFWGTVDFDPSLNIYDMTYTGSGSSNFLLKLDSNGDFVWVKTINSTNEVSLYYLTADNDDNLYASGNFRGTVDFDPNSGINNLSSNGYYDAFILKLDNNGDFMWAKQFRGIDSSSTSYTYPIKLDNFGNIITQGEFSKSVDFDPGTTDFILNSTFTNTSVFIAKLDNNGNFVWVKSFNSSDSNSVSGSWSQNIEVDYNNNIYTTGSFYGTIDFDPDSSVFDLTTSYWSENMFILKLNSNGNFVWAKSFGGESVDSTSYPYVYPYSIALDNNSNVYTTGEFYETIDFDPNSGINNLSANDESVNAFLLKLDENGNLVWARDIKSANSSYTYSVGYNIVLDNYDNIYTIGESWGDVNFNLSGGTTILSTDNYDSYIAKYSQKGFLVNIFNDVNNNCLKDSIELGIKGRKAIINPGSIHLETNNNGNWYVDSLVLGSYTITFDTTGRWYSDCSNTINFDITTNDTLVNIANFGLVAEFGFMNGYFYHDFFSNCDKDSNEVFLESRIGLINPGNFIVQSDSNGLFISDTLEIGNYTLTIDTSSHWKLSCPSIINFDILPLGVVDSTYEVGLISTQPCASLSVSVQMPFMRPCFTSQAIYVQACNTNLATGVLANGYVELVLDSLLTPTSSSIPYTSLGNNIYSFDVGTLNPGQCVNFTVSTTLSCSATFGQTLCMQANLYPADSCVFDQNPTPPVGGVEPCTLPWDNSSLSINSWCQSDTVYFSVTNTGDFPNGNMQCYSAIRVFVDGVLTYLDSVMLTGGQTTIFSYFGNGQTWTLQADQHPLHPGNSHPNASVEACGDSTNWTPGLVNTLPLDDADPVVDIYCGVVTGSYDPNDKTGYPLGVGNDHFVAPNGKIDYVIRFQNTGTDTAFTVVVRDTLDVDLDIFSVQSGVSSHDYTFKMFGPRVLEWTFNNILLPDSITDQAGSNGFVTFTVNQNPDLADGTVINNSASIYFDFNAPIFTNTTSHIINRGINYLLTVKEAKNLLNNSLFIYPNPTKNLLNIVVPDAQILKIDVFTVDGKLIERKNINKNTAIDVSKYQTGLYFINATNSKGEVYRNKFVKE